MSIAQFVAGTQEEDSGLVCLLHLNTARLRSYK